MSFYEEYPHIKWTEKETAMMKDRVLLGDDDAMWKVVTNNMRYFLKCLHNKNKTEDVMDLLHGALPEIKRGVVAWSKSTKNNFESYMPNIGRAAQRSRYARCQIKYSKTYISRNCLSYSESLKCDDWSPKEQHYSFHLEQREEKQERKIYVNKMLEKLSDDERAIINMRFFRGMKFKDMSKELGISTSAISIKTRILLKAMRSLTDDNDFLPSKSIGDNIPCTKDSHILIERLDTRGITISRLNKHGVHTIGDLAKKSEAELIAIPYFGIGMHNDLMTKLFKWSSLQSV